MFSCTMLFVNKKEKGEKTDLLASEFSISTYLSALVTLTGVFKYSFTFTHCDFHFDMRFNAHILESSCGKGGQHCNTQSITSTRFVIIN